MNAKTEFIEATSKHVVKCAIVRDHILKIGYTASDMNIFLNKLDFNYDAGYGGQELFGTIWLVDGTWISRGEYDGSEWWEHNACPLIPFELLDRK